MPGAAAADQCLSLPGSIRSPVDRRGLKRFAALIPEDQGVDGRFASCDPMLHQVVAKKTGQRRRPLRVLGLRRDRALQPRASIPTPDASIAFWAGTAISRSSRSRSALSLFDQAGGSSSNCSLWSPVIHSPKRCSKLSRTAMCFLIRSGLSLTALRVKAREDSPELNRDDPWASRGPVLHPDNRQQPDSAEQGSGLKRPCKRL